MPKSPAKPAKPKSPAKSSAKPRAKSGSVKPPKAVYAPPKTTKNLAQADVAEVIARLETAYPTHPMSEITECDPYKVLIACIMSLRTKDSMTFPLAIKLFKRVQTPYDMVKLSLKEVEQAIYPVGFYKTKAKNILELSQRLIDEFEGRVPDDIDTLLTFKGIGRKTANLTVGLGYNKPAICVDVHVHRICNRLGYLKTKTPDETEMVLRDQLPVAYWHSINRVLVCHGQECCAPISPFCSRCPIDEFCPRSDVERCR
jgi:endonuclease-3